jgi:glycerophosphoryl diester phosphodiesterase
MASFEYGLELGADLVELDVHLTRDGRLAVIHDETLDRTTNGTGLVKDCTAEELKALDAGAWYGKGEFAGQRVPMLEEVLDWAHDRGAALDIEIKNAPVSYPGIEQALVDALAQASMTVRVLVISFDHPAVQRVKALDSRIATGVLYAARPVDCVAVARQAHADAVLPHWAYVTAEDVRAAHDAGIAVAPWVSSDPAVLQRLLDAGVDAIGTNHPDVLRRLVDARTR